MVRSVSLFLGVGLALSVAGCGDSPSSSASGPSACEGVQAEIQKIEDGIKLARETAWQHQDALSELRGQLADMGCSSE